MPEGTETLRSALLEAEKLASLVAEPFRAAAFQVAASALVRSGEATVDPGTSRIRRPPTNDDLPEHVGEMLASLQGNSHQDLFEAIVFHALRVRQVDGLTKDEVLDAYSVARVPKPANASDVIAKCMRRGHLMPGEDRDGKPTLRMTVTGEQYVQRLLAPVAAEARE
jgi:hypothetical protein